MPRDRKSVSRMSPAYGSKHRTHACRQPQWHKATDCCKCRNSKTLVTEFQGTQTFSASDRCPSFTGTQKREFYYVYVQKHTKITVQKTLVRSVLPFPRLYANVDCMKAESRQQKLNSFRHNDGIKYITDHKIHIELHSQLKKKHVLQMPYQKFHSKSSYTNQMD